MPSKNSSNTASKTNKKNKFVSKLEDDEEEFYNSKMTM